MKLTGEKTNPEANWNNWPFIKVEEAISGKITLKEFAQINKLGIRKARKIKWGFILAPQSWREFGATSLEDAQEKALYYCRNNEVPDKEFDKYRRSHFRDCPVHMDHIMFHTACAFKED